MELKGTVWVVCSVTISVQDIGLNPKSTNQTRWQDVLSRWYFSRTPSLSPLHLPSCLQHSNDSFISLTTFAISRTGLLSSPVCRALGSAQLKPDTNKSLLYIHYADLPLLPLSACVRMSWNLSRFNIWSPPANTYFTNTLDSSNYNLTAMCSGP